MDWPSLVPMRQEFDDSTVADLEGEIVAGIRAQLARSHVVRGGTVAVGVGSRGISPIGQVVSTVIRELKAAGLKPFIVPAMGSHGGSTAEGQLKVLADYGVSRETVGAEVRATMETKVLGKTPQGVEVHGDVNAYGADHIVLVSRIKPHTDFKAEIESGLCKMLCIGLGKRNGAERIHAAGLADTIPEAARVALATGRVLLGVALVENPFDRPAVVRVAGPDQFHDTDRELLVIAKRILPRLPVNVLHLLVVDQIGKNISGAGMDTNVVGTWRLTGYGERVPDYRYVAALRLTEKTHGNASGIGLADFTTMALVDAIDSESTYINSLTSMMTNAARIPMTFPNDRACLETAVAIAGRASGGVPRIGRIKNTMELDLFWVSQAVAKDIEAAGAAEPCGPAGPFTFDARGNLMGLGG